MGFVTAADVTVRQTIERMEKLLQESNKLCSDKLENFNEALPLDYNKELRQIEKLELPHERTHYIEHAKSLLRFLDSKDEYTKGHCERVTEYTMAIGRAMDFDDIDIMHLELAGMLHDIGKLAVPDEIINKEGKLTEQEYEIIKIHPAAGYRMLQDISFLETCKSILLQHHERVDGKGYPLGLQDTQINLCSKIISVADAYDAMTSSRPYRKRGLSKEQAIEQLESCKGSQFDKNIVDVFIGLLKAADEPEPSL